MTATPKMREQKKSAPREIKNPKLLEFMKQECVPVKGIFKNYECADATAHIIQSKYPRHPELNPTPMFNQVLQDGQEYEVPLWVARWLNGTDITATARDGKIGSCSYPKYEYNLPEGSANLVPIAGAGKQRYGFQSLEFAA